MINNINISNLQLFNKEDNLLPVKNDLQKYLQEGIANKVETLLNTEEFINAFIPNSLGEQIKLRIHLTKDNIKVQVLEEPLEHSKTQENLSDNIKTQQEEIIKKVNSLFKKPSSLNPSTPLHSKNVHSLPRTPSIPSTSSKEEPNPCKISFDAHILKSQLDAKAKDLQNLVDRQEAFSEQLQEIKSQLKSLKQAVQNLSDNVQYSPTKELITNQHAICQQLLNLLSKRLQQIPHPNSQQDAEDSCLKNIVTQLKLKEDRINDTLKSLNQLYQEASQLVQQKEQEITVLNERLKAIPDLTSQLSVLQREKEVLETEQQTLIDQLHQATQLRAKSSLDKDTKIEELERELSTLDQGLATKEKQISRLETQVESLSANYQDLKKQLSQLQQQKATLEQSHALASKSYQEASQLVQQKEQTLEILQEDVKKLQMQLLETHQEKKELEAEKAYLTERLITLSEKEKSLPPLIISQIEELGKDKIALQNQISSLQKERNTLASELQEQRSIISDNQAEWERALSIKENLLSELEKSKALFYENHLEQLDQKKERIAELQEKVMQLDEQKNDLQNQLSITEENQAKLQEAIATKEEIISQLQQEKILLEESNSKIKSTLEKDLEADQHIETMLEQVNIHPSYPREVSSIPLENPLPIFQANDINDISPSRQYNPEFYTLYNINDENFSDEDSLASSSLSEEQIQEKERQQSTIAMLQKEIENAAINIPIKEVEKMERKIELLSSELLEKELAITQHESTVELLCNRIKQLEEKLATLKKMESKLENTQREKEDLSDDNQNLERTISSLDKKIRAEKTSKANLENDLVNQMEELQQRHITTVKEIREFYIFMLQELLAKKPDIVPDLIDTLNNLEQNNPSAALEIIRALEPSYLKEENALSFIESENNSDNLFEGLGESLAINANIQRPKPPGNWQRKARFPLSILNTI